jgi:hypothetical protein
MKTYFLFTEGIHQQYKKLDITIDNKLKSKLDALLQNGSAAKSKLLENYMLYYETNSTTNLQNSVFHKHTGKVIVTHKMRDLRNHDIEFFQKYIQDVIRKGKRRFTDSPKKIKSRFFQKSTALKIN